MSEPAYLTRTRSGYDAIAEECADLFLSELRRSPLDRALLGAFAEIVGAEFPDGRTVEVGSGPGAITDLLAGRGLDVTGIELSPAMVAQARRTYPDRAYEVGDMRALAATDLAGLVAWYSLIHIAPEERAAVVAGFARALRPGGYLLLGFQVGTEVHHVAEVFGKEVGLDFHRMDPDDVTALLEAAGFALVSRTVRAPEPGSRAAAVPQACLIARRHG
ncbi:class I SAM-dependent methyltransferase [Pseudonocardia oroxyli]|uniref:Methyltransferase domain-containing protein n=1 Tax=Pseudonocardia oroxyli TaxID=366584 RepID=A0A1G7LCN5_PSEOR|nr:class I SAM-dependent methyltransferase [Pseudonocardia oroxyli]SDF47332.1 Methyltransferase domain-containing protein [Pseudonocardia oroxyli]